MTKQFEIKKYGVELDFGNGNVFFINPENSRDREAIVQLGKNFQNIEKNKDYKKIIELQKKSEKEEVDLDEVMELQEKFYQGIADEIDNVLGKGAVAKIFKGHKISIFNYIDLINYMNDRLAEYNKLTTNRATRRAAERRK